MPQANVLFTMPFIEDVAALDSPWLEQRIRIIQKNLAEFPDMGSPMLRGSLAASFGNGCRKIMAGQYVIVYRHDSGTVYLLGIVPGRTVM